MQQTFLHSNSAPPKWDKTSPRKKACSGNREDDIYTDLVVFNCQVVSCALQMSNLHEIPSEHSLSNVDVVVTAVEICAAQLEVKPGHDAHQLLSNIISSLQRSMVNKILIAPR